MKILITGGAGYVGYSLVKQLLEDLSEIHSITIYDNLSRKNYSFFTEADFGHKPVHFIHGDILDGRTLAQALKDIECVVHLAAKVTTPYADHEAHFFDQINHWGSAQLADAIAASNVQKCIYLSSISVYGASESPVSESTEPNPHSFYGISKLAAEKQFGRLPRSKELYIIRSGNVYGYNPSYRIDAVINRFVFNAHFLNKIQINGSGDQLRSFIHVDKIARILVAAVDGTIKPGLYNAVEHNYSINALAGIMRKIYPSLETIHVNYNINMRSIQTMLPCPVFEEVIDNPKDLEAELLDFKKHFSF